MTSRLKKGVLAMHLTRKDMPTMGACAQNCFIGGFSRGVFSVAGPDRVAVNTSASSGSNEDLGIMPNIGETSSD
jgi:hypothetical protein